MEMSNKTNYEDLLPIIHEIRRYNKWEHIITSPYGVIEADGIKFKSIIEKPSFRQLVNAGIYES